VFLFYGINICSILPVFLFTNYLLSGVALVNNFILFALFYNDFRYFKDLHHRKLFNEIFSKINIIVGIYCYFISRSDLWIQICHGMQIICTITYYQYICDSGALSFFKWCGDMNLRPYMKFYDVGDNILYADDMQIKRARIIMSKLTYIFWNDKLCIECDDKTIDSSDLIVSFSKETIQIKISFYFNLNRFIQQRNDSN